MAERSRARDRIGRGPVLTTLAAASIALVGCGGSSPSPSAPPPHDFYGISPNTSLDAGDFGRMERAGVGSLRQLFYWPAMQAARGADIDWSTADHVVGEAAKHGIDVLPVIDGSPRFQAPGCRGSGCENTIRLATKAQQDDWRRFLFTAATRYGPGGTFWGERPDLPEKPITHWQIWNEENNPAEGNPPPEYAKLLALADETIGAVDPHATIVLGGMFGTPPGGSNSTAWRYLDRLYDAGAGAHFDAMALHPYSPNLRGISYQLTKVRKVMEDHGDSSTPTLITEIGWGSGGGEQAAGTGGRGQVFVVSPQQQARNLTSSFELLTQHRSTWRIGGVYWFSWKDPENPPPGLCAFCYTSGLYEADGTTPKPALSSYEGFTEGSARPR